MNVLKQFIGFSSEGYPQASHLMAICRRQFLANFPRFFLEISLLSYDFLRFLT